MKRLLLVAALAASAVSCVEGNRAVQLLEATQVAVNCEAGDPVLNGSLNFDVSTNYVAGFTLFSPVTEQDSSNRLDFFGREIVLNYESRNPSTSFTEEVVPIYLVVPAGTTEGSVAVRMIGDKARAKLEGLVPSFPDKMTLLVSVRIRGEMSSGAAVETNEAVFPIQLTRGGSKCTAGQRAVPSEAGACANPGQDGQEQSYTCGP
jgi:hypothetical protein